jgi:hypothetical protein
MTQESCAGHAGLGAEARAVALSVLDRLGPALERLRDGHDQQAAPQSAETCAVCPVCAVIAVLRGERPELAVRFAEQATAMLAVLRAALEEGDPAAASGEPATARPSGPAPGAPQPDPGRPVQRIPVDRSRANR